MNEKVNPETAAILTEALEGVILRGTGQKAALDGYRAAGKTGTAALQSGKDEPHHHN